MLHQGLHREIARTEILGEPGDIGLAGDDSRLAAAVVRVVTADDAGVAAGLVERVELVVNALLHGLRDHEAVTGAVAVLVVVEVGHGGSVVRRGQRAALAADADGLVDLARIEAVELRNGDDAAEDLPARQAPALRLPAKIGRLHGHRDALIDLITGDDGSEQVLAALVLLFGSQPRAGDDTRGGVARPGAIFPVEGVGHGAERERGVHGSELLARAPNGRRAADTAVGLAGHFAHLLADGGVARSQRDADGLEHDHLGALDNFGGDILILQVDRILAQFLRVGSRSEEIIILMETIVSHFVPPTS